MKHFAVIGHPVAHSRSPAIHQAFARQFGHAIRYSRLHAAPDCFADVLEAFRAGGGDGVNVTLPFKREAYAICSQLSPRAQAAAAVNTIDFSEGTIYGDNTDGVGLVDDLTKRLGFLLQGSSLMIFGAGGATQGVLAPMFQAGCAHITLVNRDVEKARQLCSAFHKHHGSHQLAYCAYSDLSARAQTQNFDVLINATATGLSKEKLPIPDELFASSRLAYDMFYAAAPTAFMQQAYAAGCQQQSDGLGMLVSQAAHAYARWHGLMPETAQLYQDLRAEIDAS
ncbi:MAG: shikimate dehydrogenase [Betaproteobacteria bacterium]|jgi:shikimate dehydrogenase|nr:shikimate dehydrogenase [Pseudomonadota bacterium]NBO03862.1 shikimate dehydrogenase [Betaproteobacteria bacterium]HAB48552.1 shikimate dehydrogenase [Lautropia sp.]NBO96072.1 shikimate dehydrogenase [Betaproteobacteria bacterium]NBP34843.1 shikimate dehydrogenase [Betaproteobacteria bacterium]